MVQQGEFKVHRLKGILELSKEFETEGEFKVYRLKVISELQEEFVTEA